MVRVRNTLMPIIARTRTSTYITCNNLRKPVIPKITLTTDGAKADIYVVKHSSVGETRDLIARGVTGVCPNGTVFEQGENIIVVTPTAGATLPIGVRIEYQEGGL